MKINYEPLHKFSYCQVANHGFNFALLTGKNQVLHTPVMCKDYFQDIFWSEINKKPAGIFGISWQPGWFDVEKNSFKMLLMGGKENMEEKIERYKEFIHFFEDALGIPRCRIFKTETNTDIVVSFNKKWTINGPMLSAFTTLLRLAGAFTPGENPIEYLKSAHEYHRLHPYFPQEKTNPFPKYMGVEIQRLPYTLKKLAALAQGRFPEIGWNHYTNIGYVHNGGIVSFKDFPTVEVK